MEENNIECRRILVEDLADTIKELDEHPGVIEYSYWAISPELVGVEIIWKV